MVEKLASNKGTKHLSCAYSTLYNTDFSLFLLFKDHKDNTETGGLKHIDAKALNQSELKSDILEKIEVFD